MGRIYATPEERYRNDDTYRHVVDMLESIVHRAELTPYEVREASVLACIHYEQRNLSASRIRIARDGSLSLSSQAGAAMRDDVARLHERLRLLTQFLEDHPLPDPYR